MREFLMHVPWPVYPAVATWCIAFVIQMMIRRETDYGKIALFKAMPTGGHYLKGRLPTDILTPRGVRLYRWFLACGAVFLIWCLVAVALYAKR